MSKKKATREHILATAFEAASTTGLDSLTIGKLATDVGMSKSGLFSHFQSKENLQVAVVEYTGMLFVERVIQPARIAQTENVEHKLRLLFKHWLAWNRSFQGSCMFIDAWKDNAGEADCALQAALQGMTRRWLDYLVHQLEKGKASGEFRVSIDSWQEVYRLYGIYLSSHLFQSLALETDDHQRFWTGIDSLFNEWRQP
ncbi:TetR/AcrR family transcriptional regulator [Photobacterium sanguinicancri]|uniref:TetR/AcrR family transcriptional regulator n=1 Tax=Photobacterium sanguinicancri TaxID=875932 RepID=A0AAW7Y2J3_9GAMM|nr:TetR/AcrR family transcriptional regulator [Photobacterium sanguinicancri]MDO6541187.1 TetR/AcrR family transcriptional regulator [Photobacterium sanguinicancri]